MKKYLLPVLLTFLALHAFAQRPVKLQTKKGKDIQIHSNGYVLYFSSADMIAAIAFADSVTGEDHGAAAQQLKQGRIKQVNLKTAFKDDAFVVALRKAVGAWLVLNGKAYVEKNGRAVKMVVAEDAPEMTEMNGTTRKTVFFSEPGNSEAIFYGDISNAMFPSR